MKKTIKFTAAVAMIGLMAFASAGCGGDDKKAAAAGVEKRGCDICGA